MARALTDILTELDAVYRPQKDLYNQQLQAADPALEAEKKGLMAQKEDSFRQITDQANRRGMFYSGLPIAEEQRYTGQQFLPAVANLQSKYATQKFGLQETLAKLAADQSAQAYGIRDKELAREEEQRQFDARLAAQQQAEAASRAAAARGGGGGGYSFGGGGGGDKTAAPTGQTLQSFLANQYKANPSANRATQDAWVRYYASQTGGNPNDPNLWAAYNSLYPWEKYSDKARQVTVNTGQRVGVVGQQPSLRQQTGGLAIPALGVR